MKEKTEGIKINGRRIHSIRFAGDIVIIVDSVKEMKRMLEILSESLGKLKLKINKNKTKTMVVGKKKGNTKLDIKFVNTNLE